LAAVVPSDRPWGSFQQFVHNEAVTVKIITVAPLQRLSLQRHAQRDEFWQVIDGPADIEVGGHSTSVDADGRAWIPRGSTHRLGNRGTTPVRILEIAFGHFDEDDIERLDDDYDRRTGSTHVAEAHPVQA
jgi:mannose-1-phosphate guanylyltransferase/mannose-6-phosphate isomerase